MSNETKNTNIARGGHIYYFEPNDADEMGKDQDGQDVPMFPHLEDMCVAMTLTADMYSRKKTHIPKLDSSDNGKICSRSISWISYVNGINGETDINQQLINSGVEMNNGKYLTTYYSEIGGDSYVENELVEGLGVTKVDISFESWYTPTITINFVDVRGSSLWGREEAIHDKEGNITSDTLLGVFFQQPYPLFRLQVKGFLGREVTYQLSVSSFNGRYNSQTGNFEATATFIGYSYSLLTDIPLKMIAYVSEMTYVGKKYWDEHCNSKEWEMIDADGNRRPPVKLYQFIQDIRNAISSIKTEDAMNCDGTPSKATAVTEKEDVTSEGRTVSLAENENVKTAAYSTNDIDAVETALTEFINGCQKLAEKTHGGKMIIGTTSGKNNVYEEQMLLLIDISSDLTTEQVSANDVCNLYKTFVEKVDEYNKKHDKNVFVNACEKSLSYLVSNENEKNDNSSKNEKLSVEKIFKVVRGLRKDDTYGNFVTSVGNVSLSDMKISNISLYTDTVKQLDTLCGEIRQNNVSVGNGFGEFAVIIPLGQMRSYIANIKKKINAVAANTEKRIEEQAANQSNSNEKIKGNSGTVDKLQEETMKKRIVDIVGFEPTIGNFVKMVMCHLETFIEVMMHCADQIYIDRERRTSKNFAMTLDDTDIPDSSVDENGNDFIYPWPALYNPSPNQNSETKSNGGKYEMLGWPNDYPQVKGGLGWEELKVVLSQMDAMARCEEDAQQRDRSQIYKYACLPMTGSDLATLSPFAEVGPYCKDIENITPYLGLRIANIIGIGDNNCSASDAEAIGYMDALNLISATSDYNKLKNAITSKDTNQDFASQVINYLTCSNASKQTSEVEGGKQYNLFEFIKKGDGNYYNSDRHPMYVEQGGSYKYSYTYYKTQNNDIMSIVPTVLRRFTGSNSPYLNTIFTKNTSSEGSTKSTYLIPTVHETGTALGVCQWFSYLPNTDNIFSDSVYPNYTNQQLFSLMTKGIAVKTLLEQVKALKEGVVKFKDYEVKNDDLLKKFIDRRFKVSDDEYYKIYCNKNYNYNVLIPLISKVDETYYKENLCKSSDEVSTVKLNSAWSTNTSDNFYKKLSLSVKKAGETFNNGSTEYTMNDVMVGELPILTNGGAKCSLFGSSLYYQQNEGNDEKQIKKRKAYLVVSSLMTGVDISIKKFSEGIFKTSQCSVIEHLPPFYIIFIGALLWRKSQENEPMNFDGFKFPNAEVSIISKDKKIAYIDTDKSQNWYSIKDYYIEYNKIDLSVRNMLIKSFEQFAESQAFQDIIDSFELRDTDGNIIGKTKWDELKAVWSATDFDSTSPSQWNNIFSSIWESYSSITKSTNPSSLRLLISENNKANSNIIYLYGLTLGYIVGRGTTKRVGEENNKEVTLKSDQIRGYLNGFKKRIDDIKDESDKTVKEEVPIATESINRDIAVSNYYALKHLWDSWLISAARDQFTIQNFFDKYFIFIDSFYINVYNTIKLNCEKIKDAYDAKNANLLTFITNVTSDERCMFFALPTFLDSNVLDNGVSGTVSEYRKLDMSWKEDNLRSMFKPYSFNEMDIQKPNNVFVFVYTHPYSANACENTEKKFDSYMIDDNNTWPSQLKVGTLGENVNKEEMGAYALPHQSDDDSLVVARYAYNMPCFGIAVNRANNVIFKGINVKMDSPQITSVAAQTYEDILTKYGKDGTKRVFFHGQDIFNIYSQYAYSCEVEMIGCCQIQPLMYFQLLNIPMWRGTYMIYKVHHTMSPGKMETRFIGMKMSKTQSPYATGYYSVGKKGSESNKKNGNGSSGSGTGSGTCAVGGEKMFKAIFGNTSYSITSPYDKKRGNNKWHTGVDLAAKEGTPLYAPWDGTVTFTKLGSPTAGNYLHFTDKSNQNMVRYMHLQKLNVQNGQTCKYGEMLGYLGNTGKSTGPHLHLELFINGKFKCSGQSTSHGGPGEYVNPSVEYGTTSGDNSNTVSDASVDYSTPAKSTHATTNSKADKTEERICIACDLCTYMVGKYFNLRYRKWFVSLDHLARIGIKKIKERYHPTKLVVCVGLSHDLSQTMDGNVFQVGERAREIAKKCVQMGIDCYICTFPTNITINSKLLYFIKAFNDGICEIEDPSKMLPKQYKIIKISNELTQSCGINYSSPTLFNLNNYAPIAEFIKQNLN